MSGEIDLAPGERIVWQSVDPYGDDGQRMPDNVAGHGRRGIGLIAASAVPLIIVILLGVGETAIVAATLVTAGLFGLGVVELQKTRFFRRFNHFTLVMHAPSYVSCIITDRRVVLFNNPAAGQVSLARDDLLSPVPELGKGTSGMLLNRRSDRKRFLFITDDFATPMRLLTR